MMWVLIFITLLVVMLAGLVVIVIESEARAEGHLDPWTDNAEWTEQWTEQ